MEALYFSPMLVGLNLLLALAVSPTLLWVMSRPIAGPGFWKKRSTCWNACW